MFMEKFCFVMKIMILLKSKLNWLGEPNPQIYGDLVILAKLKDNPANEEKIRQKSSSSFLNNFQGAQQLLRC